MAILDPIEMSGVLRVLEMKGLRKTDRKVINSAFSAYGGFGVQQFHQ